MLRYSLLPLFFFPLVLSATWLGGHWPLVYAVFAILSYVVVDNVTPPLQQDSGARNEVVNVANNIYLLLQIPLMSLLLVVLFMQLGPESPAARWIVQHLGVRVTGYSSLGLAIGAAAAVGLHNGSSTVVAHEMMHRNSPFWRSAGRILLVLNGDGQFLEAHLYGHHANVGTWQDPATSRRGESIYRFVIRSTVGQWLEAAKFEQHRLRRYHGLGKLVRNRVFRANLATTVLQTGIWLGFGRLAATGYLVSMIVAKLMLESVNYIQHYGLVREPGSHVEPRHSWDCSSRGSSLYLFNLTRHSEHHASPKKPFWELENHATGVPSLPHGYMVTILIALVPPLWYRYIDPLLQNWRPEMPAAPRELGT